MVYQGVHDHLDDGFEVIEDVSAPDVRYAET